MGHAVNNCEGCAYFRPLHSGKDSLHICYYAMDNHKCRLEPPDRCTHKITDKENGALGKIIEAEARRLHADGKSDREIADHFRVTPSGASSWLRKRGLPANTAAAKKEVKEVPAVLRVPSVNALPTAVAEKVRAAMPQPAPILSTAEDEEDVSDQFVYKGDMSPEDFREMQTHFAKIPIMEIPQIETPQQKETESETAMRRIKEVIDLDLPKGSVGVRMAQLLVIKEILLDAGV